MFVIYSLVEKSLSEKMGLAHQHFRMIIFHKFRRGLSRQRCIDELNYLYSENSLTV